MRCRAASIASMHARNGSKHGTFSFLEIQETKHGRVRQFQLHVGLRSCCCVQKVIWRWLTSLAASPAFNACTTITSTHHVLILGGLPRWPNPQGCVWRGTCYFGKRMPCCSVGSACKDRPCCDSCNSGDGNKASPAAAAAAPLACTSFSDDGYSKGKPCSCGSSGAC